uniref:serine--tRNA ligase n=1 Tax=Heligmosomoides polygyrus TaxID=6339 RepID=A0A8L8Q1K0_HELPZ
LTFTMRDNTESLRRNYTALEIILNKDSLLEPLFRERKGVGDIDAVRRKWSELHTIMEAKEKPKISESKLKEMWDELYEEALRIPNMSHPDVPKGGMEHAKKVATWGEKREGPCLTAEKLVQSWRTLFFPTDAAGERSYAFVGALANLERALLEYVFDRVSVLDFKPVSVPDLVPKEITEACGVTQHSQKEILYCLRDEPHIALSGTAEMGISAMLKGRTFQEEELPLRLVALSRCYRPEISNSAVEAKLYRVHEFNKIEMYVICTPEQSDGELNYLVEIQRGTFESFGLHSWCGSRSESGHRGVDKARLVPGFQLAGAGLLSSLIISCYNHRSDIRYNAKSGEKKFVHTCNGTAVASTRALISILETFQTERKSLDNLPDVIRQRLKTVRPPPIKLQQAKPLA